MFAYDSVARSKSISSRTQIEYRASDADAPLAPSMRPPTSVLTERCGSSCPFESDTVTPGATSIGRLS